MDLNNIPLMNAITKKMGWLNRRQRVIAQNIANADTPEFKAKELEPQDFKGLLDHAPRKSGAAKVGMQATHASHFGAGGGMAKAGEYKTRPAEAYEVSPNGNSVILEEQMMNMADTQLQYGALINIYRKQVSLLRTALGKNRN